MIEYMSRGEIAEHLGISLDAIKSYDRRGYLPEPDARIGRNYGWKRSTIDAWAAARPGRGARTDCSSWTTGDDGHRITCERKPGHAGKHQRDGIRW
ncbi:ssDNA-binding protein [Gordonia phage Schmidt]|uniref:SsDNA-binding protein n=1 Tax=Gordonia phage Schmidt TaxID=2301697 RepID=A0A385E071_9CAUD|nr:DNA binding protein [Gordonia phage Schmidt]AXQ65150.1 ssDNA-binding protein [Gordonia phage Schmidt]